MKKRAFGIGGIVALAVLLSMIVTPASGSSSAVSQSTVFSHLSQVVGIRYYTKNPAQAPDMFRGRFQEMANLERLLKGTNPWSKGPTAGPPFGDRLNNDTVGFPQNEEAIDVCHSDTSNVISGTNDYRGLLDPAQNFTGWALSTNGLSGGSSGGNLTNEGLLPPVDFGGGTMVPSGGDPVFKFDSSCNTYAGSLNYDPSTLFPNGIGLYKSDPATLSACPGGPDPSCWPTSTVVAQSPDPTHFLDKEWISVGDTGDGVHVWVTWSDFDSSTPPFTASIYAARCAADLSSCTAPIKLSGSEQDIQFSDVVIGTDHRTYVSWVQIKGELTGQPQIFRPHVRVADAGSTSFGPDHVAPAIHDPLSFGGTLASNSFRIATNPKITVKLVGGTPRIFLVWDECQSSPGAFLCEDPHIWMRWSDDDGATWSDKVHVSTFDAGMNYFPSIANDSTDGKVVIAYYTTRYDLQYRNRQDIEAVTVDAATGAIIKRQRVTSDFGLDQYGPNDPEADMLLGAAFIGDYIDLAAHGGNAYVGYNMNIHNVKLANLGTPQAQQDNFATKFGL